MSKKTALVIAPGRGAYQADELGYLTKHHADKENFIRQIDEYRRSLNQLPISELDQADRFIRSRYTNGENASLLIYACAVADFMAINRDKYDIVAIAGNSMGWYLALACANALPDMNGVHLVNHMGTLMHNEGVGGQILYPLTDNNWRPDPNNEKNVRDALEQAREKNLNAYVSIHLGGTVVLAGDKKALNFLTKTLPAIDRYPMELSHHAAFHTPLLSFITGRAQDALPPSLFTQPEIPIIDGNGHIWNPAASDLDALYAYTLGRQIDQTYNFTQSVAVGLKEFAPDAVIVLGPGTTMGPPVAQTIIQNRWFGITDKTSFKRLQSRAPVLLSMGIENQRALVV